MRRSEDAGSLREQQLLLLSCLSLGTLLEIPQAAGWVPDQQCVVACVLTPFPADPVELFSKHQSQSSPVFEGSTSRSE